MRDPLQYLLILATVIAAAVVALLCASCAPSQASDRVQTAITVLAEVVDPSFELAMVGCAAHEEVRERAELAREKAGDQTQSETRANVEAIRTQCDDLRSTFLGIRAILAAAEHAVAEGELAEAQTMLQQVREMWVNLKHAVSP